MLDRPPPDSRTDDGLDRSGASRPPLKLVTRPELVYDDVIQKLEEALAMAREGKIVGVAVAYVSNDGAVGTGFSRSECAGSLMGAVALLQHRLCRDD